MKYVIAPWAKTQSFRIRVVDSTRRFRRRCKIFFSAEASPCLMRTRFPSKFSTCNTGLVVDLAQWWGSAPGISGFVRFVKHLNLTNVHSSKLALSTSMFSESSLQADPGWKWFGLLSTAPDQASKGIGMCRPMKSGVPFWKASMFRKSGSIFGKAWKFSANKIFEALQCSTLKVLYIQTLHVLRVCLRVVWRPCDVLLPHYGFGLVGIGFLTMGNRPCL